MSKKIKILSIIPSIYGGGAEKFTADISHGLSRKFDHHILTYNKRETYCYSGQLIHLKIPVGKNLFEKFVRQIRIQKAIRTYKKKMKPNLSISHMLMANVHNVLSKKNNYTICILHGKWSVMTGNNFLDFFVGKVYKNADLLISVSHYIKNMFDNKYNLKVPHYVISNAVDVNTIIVAAQDNIQFNLPDEYFVYVAGFRPVKNHIKLIRQLEKYLKKNDVHLVLVGDGELRMEIEIAIEKLNLKNKVHLLGNLKNPYPVIKNASLSLLVSSSESFSLVLVESMTLGVPVIATDCGGPREILLNNKQADENLPIKTPYGFLIDNTVNWSENSLIDEISEIHSNVSLRNNFSNNGVKRAEDFDIKKAIQSYVELIRTHHSNNE